MPTENKTAEQPRSLPTASALDAKTWADFVKRLRNNYVGAGGARGILRHMCRRTSPGDIQIGLHVSSRQLPVVTE